MFKKFFAFVFAAVLFAGVSFAQQNSGTSEEGMAFEHGSVSDVFALAKDQNKYVFIDAYAEWCGPCKWMAAEIFPKKEVGEFYNENFISYKLDMEKGEGIEFAKKYEVLSYPTYLFFNPDGELVHRSGGSKEADLFILDGKNALNPETTIFGLESKYKSGDKSPETLMNYAMALWNANQKGAGAIAVEYFKTQSDEDLLSENNWNMIYRFTTDIDSREFKFFEDKKDSYSKLYGEEKVAAKIGNTYVGHYFRTQDFDAYADYVEKLDIWDNQSALNSHAWNLYEGTDDKELLEKASKWAKRSMELEQNYYNADTYAALQYKLGNFDEAEKYADIAIQLAKKNNENHDGTLELKEMIRIKKK
jgi:thiol-disulfide isomerase/thioredoxin